MRRLATLGGALAIGGLLIVLLTQGTAGSPAAAGAAVAGQLPTGGDGFESALGMPATKVVVLGSSPGEERGEAWAYGALGPVPASVNGASYSDQLVLLEHTEAGGWQPVPLPPSPGGGALGSGEEGGAVPYLLGSLGGRVTSAGGVVLLTHGGIAIRDPGAQPKLAPLPAAGLIGSGESLPPAAPPSGASTPYAAVEETDGRTGLLIAPYGDGLGAIGAGVLHYDGAGWTREPIVGSSTAEAMFTPESLACGASGDRPGGSSPDDCWLLAAYRAGGSGSEPNRLALFRRLRSSANPSEYLWEQEQTADWLLGEAPPPAGVSGPVGLAPLGANAQMLTVTPQGAWVDFRMRSAPGAPSLEASELVLPSPAQPTSAATMGPWCFGAGEAASAARGCEHSLESRLPAQYRSFASPGLSPTDPGTRIVTGLAGGAMLELAGAGGFQYAIGPGGGSGGFSGAAFELTGAGSVEQGFIGEGSAAAADDQGQSQMVAVKPAPAGDQFKQSAVPFRHPLLALAQAPGSVPGDPGAQAIAVGVNGQIGRYTPGQGWSSQSLYSASGEAQTSTLRGVAWPEPSRAYAVGDHGAMWLWRAETGLWEPDPATPYNFIGNLTDVAFSPTNQDIGYAVGKQGVLLRYGKSWEQISAAESARLEAELKTTLANLDFTAIAFAGGEAIATYRVVTEDPRAGGQRVEAGGMIVEDGSGWQVDPTASALLARLPDMRYTVLSKVAGLPDGGAVAAGPGLVIERDSASAPWRFSSQPLPEAQNVSALAAYRDQSGTLRAVVSIDLDPYMNPNHILAPGQGAFAGDLAPPTVPGQPPPYLSADPLPNTGYVLKEVASGWSDMEHMALESSSQSDMPVRPDPVLALLVSPSGGSGLAVGGQTDDTTGSPPEPNFFETAAAMRFGAGDSSAGADAPAPISTPRGQATFAVGGAAACEQACAEFAEDGLAPDALLAHALQMANQIAGSTGGLRGFLYTGDRLLAKSTSLGGEAFQRELTRYATLLGSGSPLPVRASASPNDIAPSGGLGSFLATLEPFVPGAGKAYYSFVSEGSSGSPVKVIVLDYSGEALGPTQQAWLSEQLKAAREGNTPAIVMGNASLGFALPEAIGFNPRPVQAEDAAEVAKILVEGEASAYLFDYPGVNVQTKIRYGARHIPAYGTGTLGYASPPGGAQTDSLGSSGFLLLEVDTAAREPGTSNVAPVNARVEPNIGELALAATDGTLLHRSQVGLFEGLARVPPSGRAVSLTASGRVIMLGPQPYEPIPFDCQGPDCADQVPTDYTFSSSKPDVGGFVAHEPASANPRQVELGPNELPLPDPHSGLFCAYNEGTTVVTITTGGLSYSEPITVQGGSVERPCGTVPLKNPPPKAESVSSGLSIPNSAPLAPTPVTPQIQSLVPPPPPPLPARPPAQRHAHRPSTLPPVPLAPPLLFPLLFLPPLPAPNLARPIPPSGTAPVSQQVGIAEEERERQGATEVSHHMVAYRHPQEGPMPTWPLALIPLAVAAAIALRRGGGSPEPVFAHKPARHVGSPRRPW